MKCVPLRERSGRAHTHGEQVPASTVLLGGIHFGIFEENRELTKTFVLIQRKWSFLLSSFFVEAVLYSETSRGNITPFPAHYLG